MSQKPAFNTLKTLITMLPSGAMRPVVETKDHQYIASWQLPNGKIRYAIWSDMIGLESRITIEGRVEMYDSNGKKIRRKKFALSPDVTYIDNARNILFK